MVVVYGTVCRDRLHRVERLPDPGGYVEIIEESDSLGGEALNTSLALKLWGQDVTLGGNSLGSSERNLELEKTGLSSEYLPKIEHFEPVCDIYVTPDGQRTMFGRGFRQMEDWGGPDLVPYWPGHWFTTDSNHGSKAYRAVELALANQMLVYVEDFVDPKSPNSDFWQSSTDWVAKRGDIQYNVRWLQARIDETKCFGILSDGANGFVAGGWFQGHCTAVRHYPPFPCEKLVDSTGAGDAFRAGMLFGLSQQWSLPDCLRFASAAGSLNCLGLGANTHLPTAPDVHALIAGHPEISKNYD